MAKVRKVVSKIAYIDEVMERWLQLNSDISFSGIVRKCLSEYIYSYPWIMVKVEKIEGESNPLNLKEGTYFMMRREKYNNLTNRTLLVYDKGKEVKYHLSMYNPK